MTPAGGPQAPETEVLRALPGIETFFSDLGKQELLSIQRESRVIRVPSGNVVVRQGNAGDSMFLVLYGRLRAFRTNDDGSERILGEIGPGESVGEMALLTGGVRTATVRAIRDSQLVELGKDAFERILSANPAVALSLLRSLVRRLERQQVSAKSTKAPATIAVIPACGTADANDFCKRITQALTAFGTAFHVNREAIESQLGAGIWKSRDDADAARLNGLLDQLEARYRFVIFEGGDDSGWNARFAGQADRLLFIADVSADPKSIRGLDFCRDVLASKDLIFPHPTRQRPTLDIAGWHRAMHVTSHHHIEASSPADYQALARILVNRATGLVLGGGGARGMAHLGVLRALRRAGIPIDMIGGTSMGSVIAAQYAMGYDEEHMLEINRKCWIEMDPMKDKTLPLVALIAGRKLERVLNLMFGETRIEDLWTNYFCVSTNLTRATVVVHRTGLLKQAVRASTATPGIVTPVCHDGDLLVDGGVLNNLPADEMRKICSGEVIAVEVSPQFDVMVDKKFQSIPPVRNILLNRLNPMSPPMHIPGILAIIARTATLNSVHQTDEVLRDIDLFIRPDLDGVGVFDWRSMDAVVEKGYQCAMKSIEKWQAGRGKDAQATSP
jgi:predicted acylesterase/phospholipase RssA/CRP-like cAMP-binding protein